MQYWMLMGRYNAETQTYSDFAGTPNSPFTPSVNGTLIGLRVIVGGEAATTLTEGVKIKVKCTLWNPNELEIAVSGNGLRTAPAFGPIQYDFPVNLPVDTMHPITLQGVCVEATAVTVSVYLEGQFIS